MDNNSGLMLLVVLGLGGVVIWLLVKEDAVTRPPVTTQGCSGEGTIGAIAAATQGVKIDCQGADAAIDIVKKYSPAALIWRNRDTVIKYHPVGIVVKSAPEIGKAAGTALWSGVKSTGSAIGSAGSAVAAAPRQVFNAVSSLF